MPVMQGIWHMLCAKIRFLFGLAKWARVKHYKKQVFAHFAVKMCREDFAYN